MSKDDEYSGTVVNLSKTDTKKSPAGWYKKWASELAASHKRVKKWHKQGYRIEARYQDRRGLVAESYNGEDSSATRINLFHANIKTLREMLYGTVPKIDVSRSNADADDDQARVASMMLQRMLNASVEASGSDTKSVLGYCLENRLLPGLGIARVRYEYDSESEDIPEIAGWDEDGNEVVLAEGYEDELIVAERAPIDFVHWDDFRWGWARTWAEVPWIGFRTYMKKDVATKRFGKKLADELNYSNKSIGSVSEKRLTSDETADAWDRAEVWEVWDKDTKCVYWWSKAPEKILDKKKDYLELEGFWPCPEPMLANTVTSLLLPQPDFMLAKDLYNEIDDLESRIQVITTAVRVVGVYDEKAEGVQRVFQEGTENSLIPVKNWQSFKEGGGIAGSIEWVPVQEIAIVLEKLVQQRTDAMALLYEVTGMSEIMRGGNGPDRETAEASSGKRQFASVRVQGLQEDFARFASDLMRLRAEVICRHFAPETIIHDSNIMFTADAEYADKAVELIKNWEDTAWRVEIQPESMAMIDYSSRQRDRSDFIGALGTFMSQAMGLVELDPNAAGPLLKILKWTMAGFRGSKEIEGVLDQAIDMMTKASKEKKEEPPSPEQIKAQAEQAKFAHEEKMAGINHQNAMELITTKAQTDIAELEQELKKNLKEIHEEMLANMATENAQANAAMDQDDHSTKNKMKLLEEKDEKDVSED